jgi:predicted XRE-type DNA-binding protein
MAKKRKITVSHNPKELAEALGLSSSVALEWDVRHKVTRKIIEVVDSEKLKITSIALKAETSRARITRILKGDTEGISLDVLLRILGAVGQRVEMKFKSAS